MAWRVGKPLKVFARGASLRRRVVYSLAIVRLILVPVIFLAVYYLFRMGWIVDRIVNVDAGQGLRAAAGCCCFRYGQHRQGSSRPHSEGCASLREGSEQPSATRQARKP